MRNAERRRKIVYEGHDLQSGRRKRAKGCHLGGGGVTNVEWHWEISLGCKPQSYSTMKMLKRILPRSLETTIRRR